ncbi:hypothetical protein PHAVU_004G154550 [Phaseolus vulgaris]|uniref:uncharacterized protein n=1 Tax=Phaseolus vulgaris TaxID=3885 RepID=UPI0035CB7CE6
MVCTGSMHFSHGVVGLNRSFHPQKQYSALHLTRLHAPIRQKQYSALHLTRLHAPIRHVSSKCIFVCRSALTPLMKYFIITRVLNLVVLPKSPVVKTLLSDFVIILSGYCLLRLIQHAETKNSARKSYWRIKIYIDISHLDFSKIRNIIADMRKVLSKNPQIGSQKLHRMVILENINPDLRILISCFVKTRYEEYHCVKEAILLDLLEVIRHHGARLANFHQK